MQSCDLWLALLRGYRRLLRSALKRGADEIRSSLPLLLERATEYTGEIIITHLGARHEVGDWLWQGLHEAYGFAEARGMADAPVAEARARVPSGSTCLAAFVRPLLLELANPYRLTQREFLWTRRWVHRWSHKLRLVGAGPAGFAVDLAGSSGAQWTAANPRGESLRFLDTAALLHSVKTRLKKLGEGVAPAELGLGRDCAQSAAGELLQHLSEAWGQAPRASAFPRRAGVRNSQVVAGFADIHAALAGGAKFRELNSWDYSRRDADQIHVFQRTLQTTGEALAQPAIEGWETVDESASGFRLRRRGIGARVAHRQLIAVRPGGASHFMLCDIRWLRQASDGALSIGAGGLPGLAQAVEIGPPAPDPVRRDPFVHAFVLRPAGTPAATIVLPAGWYQSARTLLLKVPGDCLRIKLGALLGRGHDYDHAGFSAEA